MEDNPYSTLVSEIKSISKNQIPVIFRIGKVVSVSPLRIETGGIVLEEYEIFVNESLVNNSTRQVDFRITSGYLNINSEQLSVNGELTGTVTNQKLSLSVGDQVIMLTESDTTFYLLCRVIRP